MVTCNSAFLFWECRKVGRCHSRKKNFWSINVAFKPRRISSHSFPPPRDEWKQWQIQGRGRGGPAAPPYFESKLRPKGPKKLFLKTTPLISGSGWPPPPPLYLKVWICHWEIHLRLQPTINDVLPLAEWPHTWSRQHARQLKGLDVPCCWLG